MRHRLAPAVYAGDLGERLELWLGNRGVWPTACKVTEYITVSRKDGLFSFYPGSGWCLGLATLQDLPEVQLSC